MWGNPHINMMCEQYDVWDFTETEKNDRYAFSLLVDVQDTERLHANYKKLYIFQKIVVIL